MFFSLCSILSRYKEKELHKLDDRKASQPTDIANKIIKQNIDIFTNLIYHVLIKWVGLVIKSPVASAVF